MLKNFSPKNKRINQDWIKENGTGINFWGRQEKFSSLVDYFIKRHFDLGGLTSGVRERSFLTKQTPA